MGEGQEVSETISPPFDLVSQRLGALGALPLVNEFMDQMQLPALLARHLPAPDPRCLLCGSKALGVLLRAILVEREPVYRHETLVQSFPPALFGLEPKEAAHLGDDTLGRALDQLFLADRAALLTEVVVAMSRRFAVRLDELHNDSTTVQFSG